MRGAQHLEVARLRRDVLPRQGAVGVEHRPLRVAGEPVAGQGPHVLVEQPGVEQGPHEEGRAAGRVEVVHVGRPVGVHAGQERHHRREVVEVLPREVHAGRGRHRDEVHGVVGRAAGREERDHAVDDDLLVDDLADAVGAPRARDLDHPPRRRIRQRGPQRVVGVHEGRAGQVQAHDVHEQLVGVGRAVEGAGARASGTTRPPRRGALRDRHARPRTPFAPRPSRRSSVPRPWAGRHEGGGQVPEGQGTGDQAGDDLVADTEHQRGVEDVVRQGDRGRHRDDVAAEQAELHAGPPLRDAIAHRGHAPSHPGDRADVAGGCLDGLRVVLERRVRREHVVVGGDDADAGTAVGRHRGAVGAATGRHGVGEVAAAEVGARGSQAALGSGGRDAREVCRAAGAAALGHPLGDVGNQWMDGQDGTGHGVLLAVRRRPGWATGERRRWRSHLVWRSSRYGPAGERGQPVGSDSRHTDG